MYELNEQSLEVWCHRLIFESKFSKNSIIDFTGGKEVKNIEALMFSVVTTEHHVSFDSEKTPVLTIIYILQIQRETTAIMCFHKTSPC